jgi:hypothetical protein
MEGGNAGSGGGGLRPDARWVVLLGVLSAVATVVGTLLHTGVRARKELSSPSQRTPTVVSVIIVLSMNRRRTRRD